VSGPIAELVAAVRSGEVPAAELIEAAIGGAERSQAELNAFTFIDTDGARERAASIDRMVEAGSDPGPLAGVPIGLKDLIDQEGIPTTNGAAFEPEVPDRSATVVTRLEDAGAVIIGRNGLHEFAYGFTSENEHFGPVRNPWDTNLSPGGSSGGSGASVAAGVVAAAVGTDTGGSVRVPAALCGVVGLKVTYGRVPLTGVTPLAPSLDTVGPIARSVADLTAMYRVMAGVDRSGEPSDPATLRIGVPAQWNAAALDGATGAAFAEVLERIASTGASIEEVDAPGLKITEVAAGAVSVEILETHRKRWPEHADRYGADVARRLRDAEAVPRRYAQEVLGWDAEAQETLAGLFASFDVLATPTVGSTRKVIGDPNIDIDGDAVFHRTVLSSYTWPVNRAGNPSLALPIPDSGAPPASLQLIGPRLGESRLLGIGIGLEDAGLVGVERPPIFFD